MNLLEELDLQLDTKKPLGTQVYGAWGTRIRKNKREESKVKTESKAKGAQDDMSAQDDKG